MNYINDEDTMDKLLRDDDNASVTVLESKTPILPS